MANIIAAYSKSGGSTFQLASVLSVSVISAVCVCVAGFWLLWSVLILFSCCCAYRHRQAKQRVQQQQRQREINLMAYHGACSYPSSMLDLSTHSSFSHASSLSFSWALSQMLDLICNNEYVSILNTIVSPVGVLCICRT